MVMAMLVIGCDQTTPTPIIPPAPKKVESSLGNIKKVDTDISNVIKKNLELGEKIDESKKVIFEQKIAIIDALSQAEKIKDKIISNQIVTQLDADTLIIQLKNTQARNLFLETQTSDLFKLNLEQGQDLNSTKESLAIATKQIIDKENETDQLRSQNEYLSTNLKNTLKINEDLKTSIKVSDQKLASANVYKYWVVGIFATFIGWTIIKNILMVYFPAARFRI